jgi:hypothetical protein
VYYSLELDLYAHGNLPLGSEVGDTDDDVPLDFGYARELDVLALHPCLPALAIHDEPSI